MPVGMLPDAKYQWQRCQLPPNSSLYLFSDGLYEVLQDNQQYIGLDDFVDLLALAKRDQSLDHILDAVIQRQSGDVASDDMSLMMVHLD